MLEGFKAQVIGRCYCTSSSETVVTKHSDISVKPVCQGRFWGFHRCGALQSLLFCKTVHSASSLQMDLFYWANIECLLCVGHHSKCIFNILFLSWRKVMSFNLISALTLHLKLTHVAFPLFWHGEDLEDTDETRKDWWQLTWTRSECECSGTQPVALSLHRHWN